VPAATDLPDGRQFLPISISRYLDSRLASFCKTQPIVDKSGLLLCLLKGDIWLFACVFRILIRIQNGMNFVGYRLQSINGNGQGDKMIYPAGNTLSALNAFKKQLNVTANNVANVNTDGFKSSRVTFSEADRGGVVASANLVETPGIPKETIINDRIVETETSNVDLAQELPEMISAKNGYTSNLKPLQAQNEMLGDLLDILG
jgi:flagellar basal-body rod protein FlgC